MQLTVVGTGYVGLVAGAGFSDFGNDVTCVDVDASKIARLERGEVPIYEPGLDVLIAKNAKEGRIRFSTDVAAAVRSAEMVFIAVGTPPAADGSADMSHVLAVAETIGKNMNGFKVVTTKSTVPVGTADRIKAVISQHTQEQFAVASNPEFLKEGNAIADFMRPDRVVCGSDSPKALAMLRTLYKPFMQTGDRFYEMDARSAELTKYAANALLASRISFMNDLAVLAEKIGADIEHVRKGVGSDSRIGPKFLFPGPGFGGSCFPKDISALAHVAASVGHDLAIVRATEEVNARQKHVLGKKVVDHFKGQAEGKTIAIWGLAFKPQTDDIRESPALTLIEDLLAAGFAVQAHDPQATANVRAIFGSKVMFADSMYGAVEGADALALVTEWNEYRSPDYARMKRIMGEATLFDGRNMWTPTDVRERGFTYYGIGRR